MSVLKYGIVVFSLLVACNVNAQTNFTEKIDKLLSVYNSNDAPGLSVKVINEGKPVYSKGFGLSNLDYTVKNSDSTVYNVASIGKQFTASAIWSLIKDQKISLEDDIRTYLPEFPEYDKSIKIKHLLNHTSGIRNYHTLMYLAGFDYDSAYYDNNTVLELAIKQKHLNHQPGEKVSYSNTNYNLLTIIIERISGQNLNDYLKHHVFNPLKMNTTFVRVEYGKPVKNKAVGYKKDNNGFKFSTSNQLSYGAGSMYASVNDLAIWTRMLNEQIPRFKPLAQFLKHTETLNSGKKANYARGLMLDTYKGFNVVGHSGYGFGGRSHLLALKEKQIGIVVLTNTQIINATRIAYQILDILLYNEEVGQVENETNISFENQDVNNFVSEYKEVNSDMTMTLFVENDTLKALGSMGKMPVSLVQFAKDKFHRAQSENVKYDFTISENHDMIISFGGTPFYFKRAHFVDTNAVNISDYIGDFYAEELDVSYHFYTENNTLKLSYKGHENITLKPIQLNEFGNNDRTLYHFVKDKNNEITEMLLSCDGTVKDIVFKKEKDR
ncbi:serine hydrolase domain-containing protein [Mangrovimonas spongiae]|uniref:Class A beta-lactamase-related serine hydrolase n=1 Tax=Mangrovimonas spongiae TaxID=2494697 RepID=A0A3R9MGR0_9FLAO|nr:serine hydrolase domain-containing protein [Mangrovimonas spongiae]RSK41738.1 class A beta-lactamase-related serine hydrolase [Mangrovimonas spongiae]